MCPNLFSSYRQISHLEEVRSYRYFLLSCGQKISRRTYGNNRPESIVRHQCNSSVIAVWRMIALLSALLYYACELASTGYTFSSELL